VDPLLELLDEARAGDASAARVRERWLRRQAEDGATLAGTLLDLAERGAPVSVRTTTGRTSHGAIAAVGTDFVVLQSEEGRDTCLRLQAVAAVRPAVGERHAVATGDRLAPLDLLLVEVLAGLAPDRPRLVVLAGGDLVAGELRAVGVDVVTLRLDGDRPSLCYIAAGAMDEVVVDW
jgi:hypothetical protein